jgi:hypothetical protein
VTTDFDRINKLNQLYGLFKKSLCKTAPLRNTPPPRRGAVSAVIQEDQGCHTVTLVYTVARLIQRFHHVRRWTCHRPRGGLCARGSMQHQDLIAGSSPSRTAPKPRNSSWRSSSIANESDRSVVGGQRQPIVANFPARELRVKKPRTCATRKSNTVTNALRRPRANRMSTYGGSSPDAAIRQLNQSDYINRCTSRVRSAAGRCSNRSVHDGRQTRMARGSTAT